MSTGLSPASAEDYDEDEYDDVDGIVDPLAGLRNEHTERFDAYGDEGEDDSMPAPAESANFGSGVDDEDSWTSEGDAGGRPPLDLSEPLPEEPVANQDELQLGADQYVEGDSPLASKPAGRKRPLLSGEEAGYIGGNYGGSAPGGGSSQGSTLFERMANLSRGSASSERDEDEDDEGEGGSSALNIPRFLGRQNNQ